MSAPTGHAAPFYCAYCGDEDIRPFDPTDGSAGHGQWRCNSCQRAFALKYLGLVNRSALVASAAKPASDQGARVEATS